MQLDPITQLPNRKHFVSDYRSVPGAQIVMLTLTGPQEFNGLLRAVGHDYSEDFIRSGAARLREAISGDQNIYHVSILGFVFICTSAVSISKLQSIINHFKKPLTCGGIPVQAQIALGLVDCTDESAAFLLRAALAAAQDSRANGVSWSHYNSQNDTSHQRSFILLSNLPAALESPDQFNLHFQPKFAMNNGVPTSAEALIRWQHPVFGAVSPSEFIPLVEATAHIHQLTDWVLWRAIAQAGAWAAKGMGLNVAINVSPRNLSRRGFAARLAHILNVCGVDPKTIELEFTEGVLAGTDPVILEELGALRVSGIKIALDDFGTGFANFSYMTHLPADILKIDRSLIQRIGSDERSALLVRTLIELAHGLNYSVVAEGIETERVYAMLQNWSCDEGQGYFMCPPLDNMQFSERINERMAGKPCSMI